MGKTTTRQEKKEERRRQILQSASYIFSRKGYWQADMESICRQARLAKGTIYLYFPSKEDLFLSLLNSILNDLLERITSLLHQDLSFIQIFEQAVDIYLSFFQEHAAYFSILLLEAPRLRLKVARQLEHRMDRILSALQPAYQEAISRGELRDIPLKDVVFLVSGLLQGAVFRWLLAGRSYPLSSQSKIVKTVFLKGVTGT